MDLQKLIRIMEGKMKILHPTRNYFHCGLTIEATKGKTSIRVFMYAADTNLHHEDPNHHVSFAFTVPTAAECIAEMDRRVEGYKKSERIELP